MAGRMPLLRIRDDTPAMKRKKSPTRKIEDEDDLEDDDFDDDEDDEDFDDEDFDDEDEDDIDEELDDEIEDIDVDEDEDDEFDDDEDLGGLDEDEEEEPEALIRPWPGSPRSALETPEETLSGVPGLLGLNGC